ncbi:MAG: sigma-70 family RNA polymerase sigma factor [Armatimonadia bacterium]
MMTPDALLVERAKQGDQQAYALLYTRYQRTIFSLIRHLTSDEEAAADLTQETFVKAWHALPRLRAEQAFGGWLRIIATNLVRDHGRRRKPEVTVTDSSSEDGRERETADEGPGPEEQLALRQHQIVIREAVARLPEPQRVVVVMHHFEDIPVAEIAVQLKVPLGTVLSRLSRGREALRRRLGPYA